MSKQFRFTLTKIPRATGGVKYECQVEGEVKPFAMYVPQSIAADNSTPGGYLSALIITIEEEG